MEKQRLKLRLFKLGLIATTWCFVPALLAQSIDGEWLHQQNSYSLSDAENEFEEWNLGIEALPAETQGTFFLHSIADEKNQTLEPPPEPQPVPGIPAPQPEIAQNVPATQTVPEQPDLPLPGATTEETSTPAAPRPTEAPAKTILINFNNVNIIEFIRFVSRISNKNFVFDENDLQFNVTIVSEEPTTIENVMTALLQVLRIHGLALLEQGNNLVIHKNPQVNNISKVVVEDQGSSNQINTEIVTQVYHLNTLDPERAAGVIRPLISEKAIIEIMKNPNHVIVTDLASNIREITQLLKNLDSPKSGLVIGQYVVRNAFIDNLIQLAQKIVLPIAGDQPLTFVPHAGANSIFIISTPYLVERTISILQYLDQFQGTTRILNPKDLRFEGASVLGGTGATGGTGGTGAAGATTAPSIPGRWERDANGNWIYTPNLPAGSAVNPLQPPQGRWLIDENGNWYFQPGEVPGGATGLQVPGGQPDGQWVLSPQGMWVFQLAPGKTISAERLSRVAQQAQELPVGHIERTQFYIHKLSYRKGNQIEKALGRIAESLLHSGTSNNDLLAAIYSVNWIESSNSLIFSGTPAAIEKLKELISELDLPLRQVFVEMLILETTLDQTFRLGVDWGSRFGGGQGGGLVAGSQAFLNEASVLPQGLDTAGLAGTTATGVTNVSNGVSPISIADASQLARLNNQYTMGLIGQSLHFGGTTFQTIGALVTALHFNTKVDIILNPKLLAEDGSTAEVFVGQNTAFPVQSISNAVGSTIAQNFEYRDVGTRLKITPLISSDDIITLDIEEEVSNIQQQSTVNGNTNQLIGPTTNKSRTTLRAHVPNKYFLVISGMMQRQDTRNRQNVPCLGGVPLIGAAFSNKRVQEAKRNLMIFIRPEIIDSEEQIDDLTKRQQNIYRIKTKRPKKDWIREDQETLNWLNLKNTDWYSPDASLE